MAGVADILTSTPTNAVVAGAALLATLGWLYTARRSRINGRKQHTFNALTMVQFQEAFRKAFDAVSIYLNGSMKKDLENPDNEELK